MKTLRHTKQQKNKTIKKNNKIEGCEPSQCNYQYVAPICGHDL